jgi:hypothetical protein
MSHHTHHTGPFRRHGRRAAALTALTIAIGALPVSADAVPDADAPQQAPSPQAPLRRAPSLQVRTVVSGLAVAFLKDQSVRIMHFSSGQLQSVVRPSALTAFGRLRAAQLGPGNVLYLTTDNGNGNDRVLAVTPTP